MDIRSPSPRGAGHDHAPPRRDRRLYAGRGYDAKAGYVAIVTAITDTSCTVSEGNAIGLGRLTVGPSLGPMTTSKALCRDRLNTRANRYGLAAVSDSACSTYM